MSAQNETHKNESGRVLLFPVRLPFAKRRHHAGIDGFNGDARVADLQRYEQSAQPDDFSQRMKINVIAFAFIVVLTLAGVWLADQLALLRKQSDCIFIGHKSCVDLEKPLRER